MALFTTFVPLTASPEFLWTLGVSTVGLTALRFIVVANIIGLPVVRSRFVKYTTWINTVCGGLLALFGMKLLTIHK